jgi:citronellyl-CoA dehydrogenase
MVCAVAVTEPDAGSDVASIRTRAVRDGDEWVINGSKMYITNSLQADWMCLLARTSDEGGYAGMSQIIVPTDRPGSRCRASSTSWGCGPPTPGLLSFTDMRVPVDQHHRLRGHRVPTADVAVRGRADVGGLLGGRRLRATPSRRPPTT